MTTTKGQQAYDLRLQWLAWAEIGRRLDTSASSASICARHHADRHGLEWPLSRPRAKPRRAAVTFPCQRQGCAEKGTKSTGEYNRSTAKGWGLYCSKQCSAIARTTTTKDGRQAAKSDYDRAYREANGERIQAHRQTYNTPERNAVNYAVRRARMDADPIFRAHIKASQQRSMERPEWKTRKRCYDIEYRARRDYGEWADAFLALRDLDAAIRVVEPTRQAIYMARGTFNKALKRKRTWQRATI